MKTSNIIPQQPSQAKSRQQKLRDFHRRNRLKKSISSTAATTASALDATSKENGKEVVVVDTKQQQLGKQKSSSTPVVKTATGRPRPTVVAPISNSEIQNRWALTPSQKKLSALVSPILPYHHQHDNKKCEQKNSEAITSSIRLKVLQQQQNGTKGGVTPSSPLRNEASLAPKSEKSSNQKLELKDTSTIQPAQVEAPPKQKMASIRATLDSTKADKEKKKGINPHPVQENNSRPRQEEDARGELVVVIEAGVDNSRSDSSAAAAENAAAVAPIVQGKKKKQPESERTPPSPPPPPLIPVVVAHQDAAAAALPQMLPKTTIETTKEDEFLEVAALKAATCPDGSSPSSSPVSASLVLRDGDILKSSPQKLPAMSLLEDKVLSIPKEQPPSGNGGAGADAASRSDEQPVVDDDATEDTVTTQSTEGIVESSDSDNTATPPAITFDATPTTKESNSSSIFSLLTPEQTATDVAVVDIPTVSAQKEDSPRKAAAAVSSSSEQHEPTANAWDTTPDVAPDGTSDGGNHSIGESPKPHQAHDRVHSPRTMPTATKSTTKAPAVVSLAETGEDETMGWETILARNSSSIKDKQASFSSDQGVHESPSPILENHVHFLDQEQQQQQQQKHVEWSDELVEEKKMEVDDVDMCAGTGKKVASDLSLPNKDACWRKVVKESGSFDILSSITNSYEQESLGQSDDEDNVNDKKDDYDEDSAMLRPSSSNVSYELRIVSRMIDSAHLQLSSKIKPNDAATAEDEEEGKGQGRNFSNSNDEDDDDSCSDYKSASTTTFEGGATSTFEQEFERTLSGGGGGQRCMSDSTGFVTDDYSGDDDDDDDDTSVTTPGAMESMDGDDECSELTPRTSSLLEEEDDEDQCDTTVDTDLQHQTTRSFSFSAAASGSPDDDMLDERRNDDALWSCFCRPFNCTGE